MKIIKGILLLGGILMLSSCATGKKGEQQISLYKSAEGRAIAMKSYDETMQLWDCEWSELWVDTKFGKTHIIISGPADGKPVFFLPGLFGDASMWYANAGALAEDYRVICPDLTVFGGKSEPSSILIKDIKDYTAWFTELTSHFGYDKTAVAGISYGSWLSLAVAREIPENIAAVIMLDPSESFAKMDGGIAWRGMWSFAIFPTRAKYSQFFDWLGGGYRDAQTDIWMEHMLDVIQYGSVGTFDVPQHRVYSPEELKMINMPILIMAGGKPILYKDPEEFAAAASRALPEAEIEIIPGTGHSLNVAEAENVNMKIYKFLLENYKEK